MDSNTFLSCVSIVTVANKVASNLNNKIAMATIDDTPMSQKAGRYLLKEYKTYSSDQSWKLGWRGKPLIVVGHAAL
jgi:hypothetical protein